MKDLAEQLQEMFIKSIINGDFEVLEVSKHTVIISINGYKFTMWVANGVNSFGCYESSYNYMQIEFVRHSRAQEDCYNSVMSKAKAFYEENFKKKRIAEMEAIKREIEMMS